MHQRMTCFEPVFNYVPQLLAHNILRILDLEVAPLGHYLLGSEWPFSESPSRVSPPLLYGINVLLVELVFMVYGRHWYSVHEYLLICQICCSVACSCALYLLPLPLVGRSGKNWFWRQGVLLTWTERRREAQPDRIVVIRSECPGQA